MSTRGWCQTHTHDFHRRHSEARRTSSSSGPCPWYTGECGGSYLFTLFTTPSVARRTSSSSGPCPWCRLGHTYSHCPHIHRHSPPHTMCVFSRTFGNAAPGGGVGVRMLVPLVDMLNHGGDQTESGMLADPDHAATDNVRCGEGRKCEGLDATESGQCQVGRGF